MITNLENEYEGPVVIKGSSWNNGTNGGNLRSGIVGYDHHSVYHDEVGFRPTSDQSEKEQPMSISNWQEYESVLLSRVNWFREFAYQFVSEAEATREVVLDPTNPNIKLLRYDPNNPRKRLKVDIQTNEAVRILNDDYQLARMQLQDLYSDVGEDGLAYGASIGIFMPRIPAGEFVMGSPEDEEGRYSDEKQRLVKIPNPFRMSMYTITQSQYEAVMGNNPAYFSKTGDGKGKVKDLDTDDFPVEMVSWNDAQEFCKRLSDLMGRLISLPREAHWEYACRAGTQTPFHYGKTLCSYQANFDGNYPYGGAPNGPYLQRTTKVGSYEPNAWGLYDMHGNVWEWCQDVYKEDSSEDPTE